MAGIPISFTFIKKTNKLSVVALLAEHSFWFSGDSMSTQFSHAIKSFKSQQRNISIIMTEVATVFDNASTKEDSTWLIQWVVDNKFVSYIILHFQFEY